MESDVLRNQVTCEVAKSRVTAYSPIPIISCKTPRAPQLLEKHLPFHVSKAAITEYRKGQHPPPSYFPPSVLVRTLELTTPKSCIHPTVTHTHIHTPETEIVARAPLHATPCVLLAAHSSRESGQAGFWSHPSPQGLTDRGLGTRLSRGKCAWVLRACVHACMRTRSEN